MSGQVNNKKMISGAAVLLGVIAVLLIPATAMAVPGSGDFVSLHSGNGREITELYNLIAKICLGVLIIVEGVLLVSILKFRRRSDDERPVQNHGDLKLEFGWTMAALLIQVWIGVATINVMFSVEVPPDEIDMTIIAEASQWNWDFYYEFPDDEDRGTLIHEDLVFPAHSNIELQVTSRDVIHAIFVPELGIKIDAVPGRFNRWWFRADGPIAQVRAEDYPTIDRKEELYYQTRAPYFREPRDATKTAVSGLEQQVDFLSLSREVEEVSPYAGYNAIEYQGTCAELCGRDHWNMYFRAVVMTQSSFERWVDDQFSVVEEPVGEAIYGARCVDCHGDDGQGDPGASVPALAGADRVTNPDRIEDHIEIVLVGLGAMQPFGAILNDAEVAAVINHERTSWGNEGGTIEEEDVATMRETLGLDPRPATAVEPTPTGELMATGERIYQSCANCHGADGESFDPQIVPPLADNEVVVSEDVDELARILIEGQDTEEYPGFKSPVARSMTDLQLASLLTYIRQSFGNEAAPVQPFEITDIRREMD